MGPDRFPIRTENLAYWFFRLNGCLCLVNFLVHHEKRGWEGTDVDVMAVRFPFRNELALSNDPMEDHVVFKSNHKIDIIIAEIKLTMCNLNGPWTDPERGNMRRVLYAIGSFPNDKITSVSTALYEEQFYEDEIFRFRLFTLGKDRNDRLSSSVVQLTWDEVSFFIYERLTKYIHQKAQHQQWDDTGCMLYDMAFKHYKDARGFVKEVKEILTA